MEYRYVLLTTAIGTSSRYGIAAVADYDNCTSVLESYPDLAIDRRAVSGLVELCNRLELSLCHFSDIVEDFLAE